MKQRPSSPIARSFTTEVRYEEHFSSENHFPLSSLLTVLMRNRHGQQWSTTTAKIVCESFLSLATSIQLTERWLPRYLNVWMPWSEQEKLPPSPVCLYIHGGGYAYGTCCIVINFKPRITSVHSFPGGANDIEIDGSFFAEIGDCVMVTIQCKLSRSSLDFFFG